MAFLYLSSIFLLFLTFTTQSGANSLSPLPQTSPNPQLPYVLKTGSLFQTKKSLVSCSFNSDCRSIAGFYSECYHGRCICDLGYRSMNGRATCQKQRCTRKSDCTRWFYGTRCDFTGTCVCDSDYIKDLFSQTCTKWGGGSGSGGDSDTGVFVGVFFGIFAFCVFVAIVSFIICRRRGGCEGGYTYGTFGATQQGPPEPGMTTFH